MEIWKPILNYEGLYQASNLGGIRSLNYHREGKIKILKPRKTKAGYLQVVLCKEGKNKHCYVHRLVWESFIGPIPECMEINHVNEDKTNNRLDNLNLMTRKQNVNWGTGIKRCHIKQINGKLSVPLYQIIPETGQIIREWPSTRECDRNGFDQGAVSKCCKNCFNREGNNIYKGFMWVTVENFYKKCI